MKNLSAVAVVLTLLTMLGPVLHAPAADKPDDTNKKVTALIAKLSASDAKIRLDALAALADLGPAAKDAVPTLVKLLKVPNDDLRLHTTLTLGKIGKDAIGPVAAVLADKDDNVRYYAIWALGLIGPEARDTAANVVKLLGDQNVEVRRKAILSLGRIMPDPDVAVPALVKALSDNNAEIRGSAAEALTRFGGSAAPAFVATMKSSEGQVRQQAAQALGALGSDAESVLPQLTALLENPDRAIVADAIDCLARIGKAALPALVEALNSDNPELRKLAVPGIGKIEGTEAIHTLVDALQSRHADVRTTAAAVLGTLKLEDKLVVLSLAEVLKKDASDHARYQAVTALQRLGAQAKPAESALIQALGDDHAAVRQTAYYALGSLQSEADRTRSIEQQLKSKDARIRINVAAMILQDMHRDHPEATKELTDALAAKEGERRCQAAFALARLELPLGDTVGVLIEALKDDKASVREQAAAHLGKLGRLSDQALPALTSAINDVNTSVRLQACWALSCLTADPSGTKTTLAKVLEDKDATVRYAALTSLWHRFQADAAALYVEALKDADANVRGTAVRFIGQSRTSTQKVMAMLVDLCKNDADLNVRHHAVSALQEMGVDALPSLVEVVALEDPALQSRAMIALQPYRARAKSAVPTLIEILKRGDDRLRPVAAETLGLIGREARDAIDALKETAAKADGYLKTTAEQALRQIDNK